MPYWSLWGIGLQSLYSLYLDHAIWATQKLNFVIKLQSIQHTTSVSHSLVFIPVRIKYAASSDGQML